MIAILNTIHKTTILLQRADVTLSDYFGASIEMREKLKRWVRKNDRRTDLAECLLAELTTRKPQMLQNEAMVCAVYLDRRFSNELAESEKNFARVAMNKIYKRLFALKSPVGVTPAAQDESEEFDLESYFAAKENTIITMNIRVAWKNVNFLLCWIHSRVNSREFTQNHRS